MNSTERQAAARRVTRYLEVRATRGKGNVIHWHGLENETFELLVDDVAALAEPGALPVAPEGFAIVPLKMTEAMRDAGNEIILDRCKLVRAYKAMLAAVEMPGNQQKDDGRDELPITMSLYGTKAECDKERVRREMVGRGDPAPMTTGEAREYLADFTEEYFTDATYRRYVQGLDMHCALAGDFAWQMATALRKLLADTRVRPEEP